MDKFDLRNPLNVNWRERFEEEIIEKIKTPALYTQERREYVRTEYINPAIRRDWEEFLKRKRGLE